MALGSTRSAPPSFDFFVSSIEKAYSNSPAPQYHFPRKVRMSSTRPTFCGGWTVWFFVRRGGVGAAAFPAALLLWFFARRGLGT